MIPSSQSGRTTPGPFALAAVCVYAASLFSQALLSDKLGGSFGVFLFGAAQLVLVVVWIVIHTRRLRDAGRPTGMVIGIAGLYALDAVLLVLLAAFAGQAAPGVGPHAPMLDLFLLVTLLAAFAGNAPGAAQAWLAGLAAVMLLPLTIAVVFSIWAAMRPSASGGP
jgi:uncharacterized membrane protein YhaH (DUF805 family)